MRLFDPPAETQVVFDVKIGNNWQLIETNRVQAEPTDSKKLLAYIQSKLGARINMAAQASQFHIQMSGWYCGNLIERAIRSKIDYDLFVAEVANQNQNTCNLL